MGKRLEPYPQITNENPRRLWFGVTRVRSLEQTILAQRQSHSGFYKQALHATNLFCWRELKVINEHYEILIKLLKWDMLIRLNYVIISLALNYPDRLLEQWKHFKKVRSHYSVDSTLR